VRHQSIFEFEDLSVAGLDEAQQAAQREIVERLYTAIRQLPKADAALVLLYLDDLSYRQMAEVLGISESNVGVKLNRAKKALRELMNEDSHEP
jgi:RNA polymerase sigma-70 factor, ECF subfamily